MCLPVVDPLAAGFHADELDREVVEESREDAGRVRAAPHARVHPARELARRVEHLRARLLADDRLEVRHHLRERVRAAHGAQDVVRVGHRLRPVAQARVDRVLQRPRAVGDRDHLGAELLHPEDVRPLAGDVLLAHVDRAREPEPRRHRRRGHAVLPGAGLRDHARFPHALHEQALAHDVVRLVRAGMIQVLALDVDPRATEPPREIVAVRHRRRTARVSRHHLDVGLPERRVAPRIVEGRAQLREGLVEHLGHERATEVPVVAFAPRCPRKELCGHGHLWLVTSSKLRASGASTIRTSSIRPRTRARVASSFFVPAASPTRRGTAFSWS